jgi:hypothetical protein
MDPATGDYTFGRSQGNFWSNVPDGVGQHVLCRLMLWTGQWFVDVTEGTAWATQVLGERTQGTRDLILRDRVATTPDVTTIISYGSRYDPDSRTWAASMTIDTAYGAVGLSAARLPGMVPPLPVSLVATPFDAKMLGVTSGDTPISMTPAMLLGGARADITDFTIVQLDGGVY